MSFNKVITYIIINHTIITNERCKIVSKQTLTNVTQTQVDKCIIESVKCWVEQVVVKLNLCPFAKKEMINNSIRYIVHNSEINSYGKNDQAKLKLDSNEDFKKAIEQVLVLLEQELDFLDKNKTTETTLIILPVHFQDFYDYHELLGLCDQLIESLHLDGVYQIASFHPNYQFEDTNPQDVENYTNRSPYPILHILREDSLEQAIERYPDTADIPERNIECMNELGLQHMQSLLASCFIHPKSN